jgi:hypothetical protein
MAQSNARFILNERKIEDKAGRFPITCECECDSCQQLTLEQRSDEARLQRRILEVGIVSLMKTFGFFDEEQAYALSQCIYRTIVSSGLRFRISRDLSSSSGEVRSELELASVPPKLTALSQLIDGVEFLLRDVYEDCDRALLSEIIDAVRLIIIQWDRARAAMSRRFISRLELMDENFDFDAIVSLAALQHKIDLSTFGNDVSPAEMENWTNRLNALDRNGLLMLRLAAKLLEGKPYAITSDNPETITRYLPLAELMGASVQSIAERDGITRIVFGPPSAQRIREHLGDHGVPLAPGQVGEAAQSA